MSHDLIFWNQRSDFRMSPGAIYEALCNGTAVDGLVRVDVNRALDHIERAFPGIERNIIQGRGAQLVWTGPHSGDGSFIVTLCPFHIECECHGVSAGTMNTLIDIAVAIDCRLYDPQIDVRFDGSDSRMGPAAATASDAPLEVAVDSDGWTRCPKCRRRFKVTDANVFSVGRHVRCGQALTLL